MFVRVFFRISTPPEKSPWNEYTCVFAAATGNLGILQWAKDNDCPWNEVSRISILKELAIFPILF